MRKIFPSSFYNPITLAGAGLAIISFGLILFLIILETFGQEQKPYMGIIAFVILPAFLILGLLLIAYGAIREHHREKLGIASPRKFPILDLNDVKHRRAFLIFSFGTIILLLFTAFGSFKAYEYTDSDEFCGTVCHEVMEPEFTAYQLSPHAKVGCVKCHIGSGADWFVRSKLSGSYQVYSVLFNKYPRPIPTPIQNLRPAQETCEQCHWPSHFYSEKKHENSYYISNEKNSRWDLTLLMKIGGGMEESGVTSGIHWHMNIANEITYIATDSTRMIIPWVKARDKYSGKETIYKTKELSSK
jgi:nitrate/TMAO reductase-like tetraheme cytochrome c subunit